jgi:hypothetical protein
VRALLNGTESPEKRDIRAPVKKLEARFDKAEPRQLAFEVLVGHEDLPGEMKTDPRRELALRCRWYGRSAELEQLVKKERS